MTKKEKKKIDNTSLNLCKNIKNNVSLLSQNELNEIFKILHKNDSKYTKNNNGVFVNLNWLDNNILIEIDNYINFCIKSNKEIKKHEIMKNIYNENMNKKKNYNPITENTEEKTLEKNEYVIDVEKTNKISSSMKFYLFKKKFQKKVINVTNLNNVLTHEKNLIT
tara:strand:- start:173 stop:667 length:495 start_codon:yes stop_codon:yes gene_type:complete